MEAGTARLWGRPHSMLRTRVVFDCAAAWTRLGVRVTRGRRPRRQRRGWLVCAAGGGGETSTNTVCPQNCQEWCASQTFLTGQSLQGQSPHSMLCLLRRAASVRTHAYACVRVCVCVRACVGLHEPHHAGAATPHIDTPKKYKKPKSGSVGVCWHVCACARACVGSVSNKTLSGPLETFSQDCGWPIHLVHRQNHNTTTACSIHIAAPSSIRVLPCLHCRGEKGKP